MYLSSYVGTHMLEGFTDGLKFNGDHLMVEAQ